MKKTIKRLLLPAIVVALGYGIIYAWRSLPIITGYGAKDMCSCVFVANRNPQDVIKKELAWKPFSLGSFSVDMNDSSATGTFFGMAKRKAIFRRGLGCTLINDLSEKQVRSQSFNLDFSTSINRDSIPWPGGNLLTDSFPKEINSEQLNAAAADAFSEPVKEKLRQTRAVLVLYDGKIIFEKYEDGFNQKSVFTGWSMAKSVTSALVGILVKQGKLNINDGGLMEEWKNDPRKSITLDQLLHANSGLMWDENYTRISAVTTMLYKKGDMAKYAIGYPLKFIPETVFQYSSGTTNIISYIVRKKTGEDYYRFPYVELFNKTGMYSAVIEPDAAGTFVGSSYCWANARDWARLGLLYLYDGVFNGQRILPEGWVKYTTTPSKGATRGEYGAQFWLNAGAPENPTDRSYPDVPTDCFWADGYEGQDVWIIPSKKLVVVRLALQHGSKLDENKFLAGIIRALP
jgi:CubicO group peptidase (beta-lactamase class C family)